SAGTGDGSGDDEEKYADIPQAVLAQFQAEMSQRDNSPLPDEKPSPPSALGPPSSDIPLAEVPIRQRDPAILARRSWYLVIGAIAVLAGSAIVLFGPTVFRRGIAVSKGVWGWIRSLHLRPISVSPLPSLASINEAEPFPTTVSFDKGQPTTP